MHANSQPSNLLRHNLSTSKIVNCLAHNQTNCLAHNQSDWHLQSLVPVVFTYGHFKSEIKINNYSINDGYFLLLLIIEMSKMHIFLYCTFQFNDLKIILDILKIDKLQFKLLEFVVNLTDISHNFT